LTAAIAVAAQSNVPSVARQTINSIGATAPIGSSPTLQIYTSLTDVIARLPARERVSEALDLKAMHKAELEVIGRRSD
jgi:hypothetical protein